MAHFCGSGTRRERARAPAAHHTGPYGTRAPFLAPTKRNLSPSYSTSIPADTTSISIAAILLRSYRYALLVAHGHIRHVFLPRAPRAARHSIASLRGTRTETRRPQRLTFAPLMVALQRAGDGLERRRARGCRRERRAGRRSSWWCRYWGDRRLDAAACGMVPRKPGPVSGHHQRRHEIDIGVLLHDVNAYVHFLMFACSRMIKSDRSRACDDIS